MKAAVGTLNKSKLKAVETAWQIGDVQGFDIPSGVSDQPFGHEETIEGAVNRAKGAAEKLPGAVGIGLEGGVTETPHGLFICNWGALVTPDGREPFIAAGASFRLPDELAEPLRQGEELGPLMRTYSHNKNISQEEGAVGFFTNHRITRDQMFEHILELLIGQWEFSKRT
ncbi:DUF84 family protein [Jeotgalibacillus aurantiacus]|uniref:DUF84 family protein n=1 Tax=Jeotgalibacillus aurantiacus TaxID=2763266 RepID=UPI001D0B29A2|nr:DUF84 family protein [Jeotgalibacillus aurantiacus]